jgi:hypothetical protein
MAEVRNVILINPKLINESGPWLSAAVASAEVALSLHIVLHDFNAHQLSSFLPVTLIKTMLSSKCKTQNSALILKFSSLLLFQTVHVA